MGKMKDFIMDFLDIAGPDTEYDKHHWDMDNLPTFEKMLEIMRKHREETK